MDLTDIAFLIQGDVDVRKDSSKPAHQRYVASLLDSQGEPCTVNWDGMERPARQSGEDEMAALGRLAYLIQDSLLTYPRDWHGKRITEHMGLPPVINVECTCEPPEAGRRTKAS